MTRAPASGDDAPAVGPFAPSSTGAVAATRFAGGTAAIAPTTGTFAVGDFVIAQTGKIWICTVAGTPGTWVASYVAPIPLPVIPASPAAADVAAVLVALGLATQGA